jgi:hypothetical protein
MAEREDNRFFYWYLPMIVLVPSILFYFSGVRWMVEIICPSANREYGLIENLQLLIILYMAIISAIAVKKKDVLFEKIGFGLLSLFALFVLFEEMDWGAHFAEAISGKRSSFFSDLTGVTNIHNQDDNAKWFKRPVYLLMASLFIIFPLLRHRFVNPFLQYLTPKRMIIGTVIIAILSDLIPRLTVNLNIRPDAGFANNIGEFSEVMVYYTFALYLHELIFEKSMEWERVNTGGLSLFNRR